MNVYAKFEAEGRCRLCQRPTLGQGGPGEEERQLTRHRLVPGRDGGPYTTANVVPLCAPCHMAVERSVADRRMLRERLWPVEVAYVLRRMGQWWLDNAYPKHGHRVDPEFVFDRSRTRRGTTGPPPERRKELRNAARWRALHLGTCTPLYCSEGCPVRREASRTVTSSRAVA